MPYLPYFGVLSQSTAPVYAWSLVSIETAELGSEDILDQCTTCFTEADFLNYVTINYPPNDYPGYIAGIYDSYLNYIYIFESVQV